MFRNVFLHTFSCFSDYRFSQTSVNFADITSCFFFGNQLYQSSFEGFKYIFQVFKKCFMFEFKLSFLTMIFLVNVRWAVTSDGFEGFTTLTPSHLFQSSFSLLLLRSVIYKCLSGTGNQVDIAVNSYAIYCLVTFGALNGRDQDNSQTNSKSL